MKLNKKIFALMLILIAILSVSAVSAENVADDIVASDDSIDVDDSLSSGAVHDVPADASVDDIKQIIANTAEGDTLSFAENAVYDFGNISKGITISHTLILQGNNATIKGYQGFVFAADEESIDGSQVYNFNFEVYDPDVLWNGRALDFGEGKDFIIENCSFRNGNSAISLQSTRNSIVRNNYFFADEGATNRSTIKKDFSKQEQGAKAINIGGGSNFTIVDNIIEGDWLDAFSLAKNAATFDIHDNVVIDVWYGIFYGGGVKYVTLHDNEFYNSKAFALGFIKAAGDSEVYDNIFVTPENETAIYVEEGNTAHGAPSKIATIEIYDNVFFGPQTTLLAASSQGGFITPSGQFTVVGNMYDEGVTVFQFTDNNTYTFKTQSFISEDKNVTIDGNIPILYSSIDFVGDKTNFEFGNTLSFVLIGEDDAVIKNADVYVVITSGDAIIDEFNATTGELGQYEIPLFYDKGDYNVTVFFPGEVTGSAAYKECEGRYSFSITSTPAIIVGKDITLPSAIGYKYEITLKDDNNMLLTNRTVQITVNGVTYNKKTDENGIAGLNIRLAKGEYNITTSYTNGNDTFTNVNTLTVEPCNTTIKSTPSTYTKGTPGKFEAQLVNQIGQPITAEMGGVIIFHINGVNYYKATDNEGKAYLNINLGSGIYNMYMSFDGTNQYAGSNGGSQVTVV
jgi:hypothetical protein